MKTLLRFSRSRLMKPMAEMLVASGQGLMAVSSPNTNADTNGALLFAYSSVRNFSIYFSKGSIFSLRIFLSSSGFVLAYMKPSLVRSILFLPLTMTNV